MRLFHKSIAQLLRVLGAEHGDINKFLGWSGDVQSRYYTWTDLQAGDQPQAILAGFTSGGVDWRQQHHLGRSTVPLPSTSWLDALTPQLTQALQEKDALPVRSQETLECLRMCAEAYWQAVPIKGLRYGEAYLDRQVPGVLEVMQTAEYRQFADQVIRKEADSLQKLGLRAPHLAMWTSKTSRSSCAALTGSSESVPVSAEATSTSTEERPAKRQRQEAEIDAQAQPEMIHSRLQQAELGLQHDQQLLRLEKVELLRKQVAAERAAVQQASTSLLIWSNAQLTAQTCFPQGVRPIPAGPLLPIQVALPSLEAPVNGIRDPEKQANQATGLHSPDFFTSSTVAGRYQEWADDGKLGSIKSRLVPRGTGLRLPKTGHTARACDNLRKNRNLPEAIDGLIGRGLSREAAISLVEKVVSDCGLTTISQQSIAFHQMAHKSAEKAKRAVMKPVGMTVRDFTLAFENEVARTLSETEV